MTVSDLVARANDRSPGDGEDILLSLWLRGFVLLVDPAADDPRVVVTAKGKAAIFEDRFYDFG